MADDMTSKHVYGPVFSRRLGRSLGVDLVPYKVCTYDCIYCQLGRTTIKTTERREYIPAREILKEVGTKLKTDTSADYITIAGSGEPTLNSALEEIVVGIKNMTDIPLAVLTNGSLLFMDEVKKAVSRADLLIPSLDAGSSTMFKRVNRPHKKIRFSVMARGLVELSEWFNGKVWLESLIVKGFTDSDREAGKIASTAKEIGPGKIQLNTVLRPPTESAAIAVPPERMKELAAFFEGEVEIIAKREIPDPDQKWFSRETIEAEVNDLVKRRPVSALDISNGLSISVNEVLKVTDKLFKESVIKTEERNGTTYFVPYGRGDGRKNRDDK